MKAIRIGTIIQVKDKGIAKVEYVGLSKVEARLIPSGVLVNATGKIRRLIREV